jgi:excisionase family DNA binding protein
MQSDHFCYYRRFCDGLPLMSGLPMFLTVDELASVLRCQPEKVYRLAARGELPSYKVEGRRLFAEQEVRDWLTSRHEGSTLGANGSGR